MKLKEPVNKNYCGTIVKIKNIIPLSDCDNVVHSTILGNSVIVSTKTQLNEMGIFFPLETKLSEDFLSANNLYRKQELNSDTKEKGYFEENGRIKCVKFRGYKSEGFFIPLNSLKNFAMPSEILSLKENDEFDTINGIQICEKYIVKNTKTEGLGKNKQAVKRISRLVPNQFRLHSDTENLRKNIHKIKPTDLIDISNKLHGTSFVVGKVLTKKKNNWFVKLLAWLGVPIIDQVYDVIYSSRKVVKNEYETKNINHFYGYDLWSKIKDDLKDSLEEGISLYGECVGYTKDGNLIQEGYDYGYIKPEANEPYVRGKNYGLYIYKITMTSASGKVYEFNREQVREYCKKYDLGYVPCFYYGQAINLFQDIKTSENWNEEFLKKLENSFNLEKDCNKCKNQVPAEGIVLTVDKPFKIEAYKLKSYRFLERETKQLDKGILDMESSESIENQ